MSSRDTSVLERAFGYPYARPAGSFVFDTATGGVRSLREDDDLDGRVPVLAIGSNAAPEQLRRKFARPVGEIPTLEATVSGIDVVHAARVTAYGAVPATVCPSPGTVVIVHVSLLTPEQLAIMDESEAVGRAYRRTSIPASLVTTTPALDGDVGCYEAICGPLHVDGAPRALAAVRATGRSFAALTGKDVLHVVAGVVAMDVEAFVLRAVRDAGFRAAVHATLGARYANAERSASTGTASG